jgi:two-component system, OmpR family, KDP operon response regulator KdpE
MMAQSAGPLRVLVVEDEPATLQSLRIGLNRQGHTVSTTRTGRAALKAFHKGTTDLVILELDLPDIDGLDVIEIIRSEDPIVPIMVLSSPIEVRSRVMALDLGADDCLIKPFGTEEFLAHVRLVQRHRRVREGVVRIGDLSVDLVRDVVTVRGDEVRFSRREYDLLRLLVNHAGTVLTQDFIVREVWGCDTDVQYLRIYIRALRRKIEPLPGQPCYILTETGVGYRMRAPD